MDGFSLGLLLLFSLSPSLFFFTRFPLNCLLMLQWHTGWRVNSFRSVINNPSLLLESIALFGSIDWLAALTVLLFLRKKMFIFMSVPGCIHDRLHGFIHQSSGNSEGSEREEIVFTVKHLLQQPTSEKKWNRWKIVHIDSVKSFMSQAFYLAMPTK